MGPLRRDQYAFWIAVIRTCHICYSLQMPPNILVIIAFVKMITPISLFFEF